MQKYRFKKKAGALQEAYDELPQEDFDELAEFVQQQSFSSESAVEGMLNSITAPQASAHAFRTAESTGEFAVADLRRDTVRAQSMGGRAPVEQAAAPPQPNTGLEPHWQNHGGNSMFFYTIEEGKRVLVVSKSVRMQIVKGPARVFRWGHSFRPMKHYVAHPSEFLIVRYRDGRQEHLPGPAHVWFDPREVQDIDKEEALPIADKEAIIVYAQDDNGDVERRIEHGPATFVPKPGEWLHTFSWHGNVGGRKVPGALEFQKLWLLPDQMYHDVPDVRTADDAVLTIRLMMFFELIDIETMLATTHDPVGDFLNAATSDVVDFVGRHSFEAFKQTTERLNDLATYKQLTGRANQIGYRINRVVYRGYGAKASLEQMHDQAIESRTRLQLEKATEQQAQELEDLKQERQIGRAAKQRSNAASEARADMDLDLARRQFARDQARLDAEQRDAIDRQRKERDAAHLASLGQLGVDLTRYLTQNQADQVIELRGNGAAAHVHLPGENR
jgi:hypothetical protein